MQNVVPTKYRGSRVYENVKRELIYRARSRELLSYDELATLMGLSPAIGEHMANETGRVCGEISEDELAEGQPMLSAVVVGVSGLPGQGFFTCARKLGRMRPTDTKQSFWERERDAVYDAWKEPPAPK